MLQAVRSAMGRRSMSMQVFNRAMKRQQRNNAAQLANSTEYEYLREEVARRLVDRLEDIDREFPLALDLGAGSGHIYKSLAPDAGLGGIKKLLQFEFAENLLLRDVQTPEEVARNAKLPTEYICGDEEFLPFPPHHFDLVISSCNLHWVNDLPSTFTQVLETLKPDGVFLGAVLGGDSLCELRSSFILADQERKGGILPHISPFVNVADAGNLLQSAGFTLPTVDTDYITVEYPDAFVLMEHLQGMAENNAPFSSSAIAPSRDTLLAAASIYQTMYGNEDGSIPVTFQVIYFIGWSPHSSQQQPKKRGSATKSLRDLPTIHHSDAE
ncbi:hypothetical protein SPRG_02860 [Saprolegnia parasitica CBS 223.65]|uniref:Methyltransferase type 11 domain-containing protein n=1 Tax=Saprolegnia parasitica (strain CBS 223.65) TaxID=695850 RepID=A0A067CPF3_SAPPC|nr:hypothetical protein SPRG_02860 [Saprolegnia parasitica CBS 223.65]KDO32383.1 hypothetical protein SPRG_02860 [Saprolegnia parasitica CBS 223.65]|eukprot:XP_012196837.1 hypothetical protein SPRG_02860 [Saprolegnia parasitica CBS 223.65]